MLDLDCEWSSIGIRQSMCRKGKGHDIPSITKYKVSMSNGYATESRSDDPVACICSYVQYFHDCL